MRPIVSKQNTLILFLCTTPSILGIVILVFFTTNGLDFQNEYYLKLGLICWTTINSTTLPLAYLYSRKFDKRLVRLKNLENNHLSKLSTDLLQMPIKIALYLSFILLVENVGLYYILEFQGVSQLSLNSFSISLSSSLIAISPIGFFCSTFFLRRTNQQVYAELKARNLEIKAPFLGYRFKLLIAFGASIIGIAIWLIGFSYYYSLNNSISNSLIQTQTTQETILAHIPSEVIDSEETEELLPYLSKTKMSETGSWLVVNKEGKVELNPKNTILYTEVFPDLNERMRSDFLNLRPNTFYDNKGTRLISYIPINKKYSLVFVTLASDLMTGHNIFWIWATVFILIALTVLFFVTFVFSETIVTSLKYLSKLMLDISKGDLTQIALIDTVDETSNVLNSYNILVKKNTALLQQIKQKSEEFLVSSKALSEISNETAQSSIQQAATTEELSTSLQEKLETEQKNSEKARTARDISLLAAKEMKESTGLFKQTLKMIEEISERTSIISDIAKKTDMLSINASIEAARSGEIGRGFGVVALEIRKLADRTKTASVEIDSFSETGHEISSKSNSALNELIPQVNDSASHVSEIFASNEEQQSTTKMINDAITELSEVSNLNAASSEEVSASAIDLADSADFLFKLVNNYKINEIDSLSE